MPRERIRKEKRKEKKEREVRESKNDFVHFRVLKPEFIVLEFFLKILSFKF